MISVQQKLAQLGLALPEADAPSANYVASVQVGNLLMISGQICMKNGAPGPCGHLGASISVAEGFLAAQSAALGLLAQALHAVHGDATRIERVMRLGVFIASTPEFTQHSEVANGASDVLTAVFGEIGRHARTSVGVAALPAGVAVELDAMIAIYPEARR